MSTHSDAHRVAIVAGLRTPFARQSSAYKYTPAVDLGQLVVSELVSRSEIDPQCIEQLVYGQVVQYPKAPNIAREIVLLTGMNVATDAYSVTRACATSFQAAVNVAESIAAGSIDVGIAGGADSSSVLPILVTETLAHALLDLSKAKSWAKRLRILGSLRPKHFMPVPPAVKEYSTGLSMGQTAEQMAKKHGISREEQDAFAHRSHELAAAAWREGKMQDEVMTAYVPPHETYIEKDNLIREDSTLESYARLRPVFDRKHGSVTAANSSALTDGASAILLMRASRAKELGFKPLGYLKSYAFSAIDVEEDMLMGPAYAIPQVLRKSGLTLKDIDLIEMHEAFASQVLANVKMLGSKSFAQDELNMNQAVGDIDMDKFNVLGGSLAYGHPFAATGTRLLTQLCHELKRRGGGVGLTTGCAAGGLGAAMIVEVDG